MNFQRARKPEEKSQRLAAILNSAGKLFEEQAFESVTMRQIAESAGLGKASLYHYFQTKEEVFLALSVRETDRWLEDFTDRMGRMRKPTPERVARLIADLAMDHSRFSRLIAIMSVVLERNVPFEKLKEFKLQLLERFQAIGAVLSQAFPEFDEAKIHRILLHYHVSIAGLWPIAHPNEELKKVLQDPQLREFQVDFRSEFETTMLWALRS